MPATYRIDLRAADGTLKAVLPAVGNGGVLSLAYRKMVNAPGLLTFTLNADDDAAALLEHRGIVEVWRKDDGVAWYRDFSGLILRRHYHYTDRNVVTIYCPGVIWLLSTRHVLYYADTANKSAFTSDAAETIANALVKYNATADATTTAGRIRNGAITVLSAEAAGTAGNTLDWYCAWDNLLETLQAIADAGDGDFDVVQTGDAAFQWRWYDGQLGTDRSATVTFALEYGNMARPVYDYDRRDEAGIVVVLGQGEGAARSTVTRTSGDSDVEMVADARDVETTAGLNARGDARLVKRQAVQDFGFSAVRTASCVYGLHYFLGDLVTARYGSVVELTRKITAVNVTLDEKGREVVEPEFGTP
jgi:hypothetical protein